MEFHLKIPAERCWRYIRMNITRVDLSQSSEYFCVAPKQCFEKYRNKSVMPGQPDRETAIWNGLLLDAYPAVGQAGADVASFDPNLF
jgi:hypothetical protein